MTRILAALLLTAALVLGQAASNSVTVTASRNATLTPDQVVFGITVNSGLDGTPDAILTALQTAGITQAVFSGVSTVQAANRPAALQLAWTFSLPVPFAGMKATTGLLTAAQAAIAKQNPGLTMSFAAQGTQVSPQLQQSQSCAAADLLADARTRAQKLADAAGQPLGAVLAMSSSSVAANPAAAFSAATYLPACTLTVKFALGATAPADGDTLNITATRTTSLQPDQAIIGVSVTTAPTMVLDDVVALLAGSGITAANLSYIYAVPGSPAQSATQWSFSLPVTFAKLQDELSSLAQIQQSAAAAKPSITVQYSVQGTQISPELQAAQTCSYPALSSDARAQALKLAAAAGLNLGSIVAVADASSGTPVAVGVYRVGDFATGLSGLLAPPAITSPSCSMLVRFQLLH